MRYRNQYAVEQEVGYMPSRYLCDVLSDMRDMHKTRNYSGLMGSIEQAQVMASRMEAALGDKRTIEQYDEDAAGLGRELKAKRAEVRTLNKELDRLKSEKKTITDKIKKFRGVYNKESKGGTLDEPKSETSVCCDRNADMMPCDCNNRNIPACKHCGSRHTGVCGPHDIG